MLKHYLKYFLPLTLFSLIVTSLAACSSTGTALLNIAANTDDYTVTKNITYGSHRKNKLDVYQPLTTTSNNRKQPVLVFFYGGCWGECSTLNKSDYLFVAQSFASRGYVTVIADFRQYPEVRFDPLMQGASNIIRWTIQHISTYGGDSSRLIVAGHSSGAHIASMLALSPSYLSPRDKNNIRGFIGLAGPYDFLPFIEDYQRTLFASSAANNYANSQPINFLSRQSPPLLLLHGEKDLKVGKHNSVNLARKAQRLGVPHRIITYPQHDHVSILLAWSRAFQKRSSVLRDSLSFIQNQTR